MKNSSISIVTFTSAILLLSTNAHAKDWYLGGSIGYNQTSAQTNVGENRLVEIEFDSGIATTSVIGKRLDNNFRVEGEFSWRRNDGESLAFNGVDRAFTAKGAQSYGIAINGLYDFDIGNAVTPYIGAGIGFDYIENEFLYGPVNFEDNDVSFAWQVMGGLSTSLTEKIEGFVDARYHSATSPKFVRTSPMDNGVELDSEYNNFTVSVGYRYSFK